MPLQGVWTADSGGLPPWKGDYHNDLNTQTTYIAYQTAGLFDELGTPWLLLDAEVLPAWLTRAQAGQPLRIKYLQRAIAHMKEHQGVWFATGSEIIDAYQSVA